MNAYVDVVRQNTLGMLIAPIVVIIGIGAVWFWFRRQQRTAWDILAVIAAALGWLVSMYLLNTRARLSPLIGYLIGIGIAISCWSVFNGLGRKSRSTETAKTK
jgi:hypothetical protein